MIKLVIIFILVLSGCSSDKLIAKEAAGMNRNIIKKEVISHSKIIPLALRGEEFNGVLGWYKDDTVLISENSNGRSIVNLYSFFTGRKQLFFESNDLIVNVVGNKNKTLFAIHESKVNYENKLKIVNENGLVLHEFPFFANDLQLIWNPYNENQLLIVTMHSNLDFNVFLLDIDSKELEEVIVANPFIQWLDESQVAYLSWDNNADSNAPLYVYDINKEQSKKLINERLVTFFAFPNTLLGIEENEKEEIVYTFYNTKTLKKYSSFSLPTLNTYSEHWWIPEHDFVERNQNFYYMRPIMRAKNKVEEFVLTAFQVESGESEDLISVKNNASINCSSAGQWCLYGQQLENIINVNNKFTNDLITLH